MKRAGTTATVDGCKLQVYNTGAIARGRTDHEHMISISTIGGVIWATPKQLENILAWYNSTDITDEREPSK